MNAITLSSSVIKNMFQNLYQTLGGELSMNYKEHILNVDNDLGKGIIRGMIFNGGISYLEFDMTFSENFQLTIGTTENAPICFAYCSKGNMDHSFDNETEKRTLENFQIGIITNEAFAENVLYFKKEVNVKTTLITVKTFTDANEDTHNGFNERLQEIFLKQYPAKNSVYLGSYNLKVADKIQQLEAIKQDGIVRNLLIEGQVHMILALELQQHADDLMNLGDRKDSLTTSEMDLVLEVSKFIENYPERALTIAKLCSKSGLSPSKLQDGFKLLHGTTVSDYIRDVRLIKAEELIKNTDLNISEVVYSIGLTSRSYFSKIFKKKYNCSPKNYKDKQTISAISA